MGVVMSRRKIGPSSPYRVQLPRCPKCKAECLKFRSNVKGMVVTCPNGHTTVELAISIPILGPQDGEPVGTIGQSGHRGSLE